MVALGKGNYGARRVECCKARTFGATRTRFVMKYLFQTLLAATFLILTSDGMVLAQEQDAAMQDAADVIGVIDTFFDGFARQDSLQMASVMEPGARLVVTTQASDGPPIIRPIPMERFIPLVANRKGAPIEETIWNRQVEVTDNLATVWVHYNLWVGDTIDHCGRDAFQLARFPDGWKIIAIADTQRREGCVDQGLRRGVKEE